MNERVLGLPRSVFLLGVINFFNDFSSEMVFFILPAFFISVSEIGRTVVQASPIRELGLDLISIGVAY